MSTTADISDMDHLSNIILDNQSVSAEVNQFESELAHKFPDDNVVEGTGNSSTTVMISGSRKHKRCKKMWKKNKAKIARAAGQDYVSISGKKCLSESSRSGCLPVFRKVQTEVQ